MTNLRVAIGFALFLAGVGPAAAQERALYAWVPGERVELVYDVFAGGRIAEMSLEFGVVGNRYSISTRQASAGVLSWLWPLQSVA